MDDKRTDTFAHALDIEEDYVRLPSEIAARIENLDKAEGMEYELARDNMLTIIKDGAEAMTELKTLAIQTQHPRMFEVFTELMKTMVLANRELMEVKRLDTDIQDKRGEPKDITPQQNILVCSTSDLAKLIAQREGK